MVAHLFLLSYSPNIPHAPPLATYRISVQGSGCDPLLREWSKHLRPTYPMSKLEIQTTCGFKESTKNMYKSSSYVVKKIDITWGYPSRLSYLPSRKITYPTLGKGKSSSNMPYQGDMLVPLEGIVVTCCDIFHVEHTIRSYGVVPFDGCNAYVFASVIKGICPEANIIHSLGQSLSTCCLLSSWNRWEFPYGFGPNTAFNGY